MLMRLDDVDVLAAFLHRSDEDGLPFIAALRRRMKEDVQLHYQNHVVFICSPFVTNQQELERFFELKKNARTCSMSSTTRKRKASARPEEAEVGCAGVVVSSSSSSSSEGGARKRTRRTNTKPKRSTRPTSRTSSRKTKREMSDHSQVLGQYLLKGWCMLQETCPDNPSVPLMRSRAGVTICVACQNCAHYPRDEAQPQPAAAGRAAPGRFTGATSAAVRAVTTEQKTNLVSSTKTAATVMDAPDGWQFAADDAEFLSMSAKSMKDSTGNDVDEDIKADDLETLLFRPIIGGPPGARMPVRSRYGTSAAGRAHSELLPPACLRGSKARAVTTAEPPPDDWQFAADLLSASANDHDLIKAGRDDAIMQGGKGFPPEKAADTSYDSNSTTAGNIDLNKNANKKIYSSTTSSGISSEQMENWEMLAAKRKQLYRLLRDDVYYFDKMSHLLDVLSKMDTVLSRYDAVMAEKEMEVEAGDGSRGTP